MKKTYLLSDGRTRTVPPEHEAKFFADLEKANLTATLISSEPEDPKDSTENASLQLTNQSNKKSTIKPLANNQDDFLKPITLSDEDKSGLLNLENEIQALEKDLLNSAKLHTENNDNFKIEAENTKTKLAEIEKQMKAISEGEYKSQDEWDLANLRHLELKNDYDDLIKNHNTLLEGLGTEGGEYETKYNLYKEKLIEHNNALFEIQGRNKKGKNIEQNELNKKQDNEIIQNMTLLDWEELVRQNRFKLDIPGFPFEEYKSTEHYKLKQMSKEQKIEYYKTLEGFNEDFIIEQIERQHWIDTHTLEQVEKKYGKNSREASLKRMEDKLIHLWGEKDHLTYLEKRDAEHKSEIRINAQRNGVFDFLVSKDHADNTLRKINFFSDDIESAIKQLQYMLPENWMIEKEYRGVGYGFENPFSNMFQVKITNPDNKDFVYIEFDQKPTTRDPKTYVEARGVRLADDKLRQNSIKLINFVNKNLTKEDEILVREKQGQAISLIEKEQMKGGDLYISEDKKQEIVDKYSLDKKPNLFRPIIETSTYHGKYSTTTRTTSKQPYEEELAIAKQQLISMGNENPSEEQIHTLTRANLIRKENEKLIQQKYSDFMNTIEDEGKYGDLIHHIELGSLLKREKDIKAHAAYIIESELRFNNLENSEALRSIQDMESFLQDPNQRFIVPEGEKFITLDDGRKVPENVWNEFQANACVFDDQYNSLQWYLDDNNHMLEMLENSAYKNSLLQKNYNDWERFFYKLGDGTKNIIMKGLVGTNKLLAATVGATEHIDNLTKQMQVVDRHRDVMNKRFQDAVEFKDAFKSIDTFARFFTQDFLPTFIPNVAAVASGPGGIALLAGSSGEEAWLEIEREDDFFGRNSPLWKKALTSAGYMASEYLFDRYISHPMIKRSYKSLVGGSKNMLKGKQALKKQFREYAAMQLIGEPVLGGIEETLVGITQNLISGKHYADGLGENAFAGIIFGSTFGWTPYLKGMVMNSFSDPKTIAKYKENDSKIADIENSLANMTYRVGTKKTLENELDNLKKENENILDGVERKFGVIGKTYAKSWLSIKTDQFNIEKEADKISRDKSLDEKTRKLALDNLQKRYNANQAALNYMNDNAFGSDFTGFMFSKNKDDVERKDRLYQEALSQLSGEGKTDPSDADIEDRARILYNTEEINNRVKKNRTKLGDSFKSYQTVDEAITAIEKMNIDQKTKDKLIQGIKNGNHGANVLTKDGVRIPFQVVENMAKDDRLETRTHELGHTIFAEIFGGNIEAITNVANQIEQYLLSQHPQLHTVLVASTTKGDGKRMDPEETLAVFLELVAENKIDLMSKDNYGLGGVIANTFSHEIGNVTNSDFNFDFRGETDAVNFMIGLGKKIKNNTLGFREMADIRRSEIAKRFRDDKKKKKDATTTRFSEALKKNTAEIVAENKRLYDKIKEDANKKGVKLDEVYYETSKDLEGKDKKIKFFTAVSDRARGELVINNMATANRLARKAYDGGLGAGSKKLKLDQWQSGFFMELTDLARTWNPAEGVPFGAYVNKILPTRYGQILKAEKGEGPDTVSISTPEGDIDISDVGVSVAAGIETTEQAEGKLVNKELDLSTKSTSNIENTVRTADVSLDGLTYKGVKKLITDGPLNNVLDIVSDEFGIDPKRIRKNQDLDSRQRQAARNKIIELSKKGNLIDLLPEGTDRSGQATGVAPSLLNKFYIKGDRAKVAKGATAAGLVIKVKNPNITNADFLSAFGINPDGTSKKGTSLDGALRAFVLQIAQLEANQQIRKHAIEKGIAPSIVEKVGEGKSEVMFSQRVDVVLNLRDSFQLETKGIDKLLQSHGNKSTFNIKTPEGRKKFIKNIKTTFFPMFEKEFFFTFDKNGNVTNDIFTYSGKNYGLRKSKYKKGDIIPKGSKVGDYKFPEEVKMLDDFRSEIRALAKDNNIEFGNKINGVNWNLTKTYNTIFGKKGNYIDKIKEGIDNGDINKWNNNVELIHKEMWNRFNKAIRADKTGEMAQMIGTYLKLTANDKQSWHRLGAQLTGYSKGLTKRKDGSTNIEFEHAMPATAAYLYLMDAALSGSNFNTSYDLVIDNYKLIVLDKAMDDKLKKARTKAGYSLQQRMPDNWSVIDGKWWERYFNELVVGVDGKGIDPNSIIGLDGKTFAKTFNIKSDGVSSIIKSSFSRPAINTIHNIKKAHNTIDKFKKDGEIRGMSTFDFDETVGVSENYVYAKKGKETKKIASNEWPIVGEQLAKEGWKFDFTDFNRVTKGKPGPLLEKMKNQIKKYGPKNVFILTARAPESQKAIYDWLKSEGVNIPIKNITGLGNSTGEAKAQWMLEKFAEGYNDMYFVDDALPNVEAVKNVLDQLDIKSKVVQAKTKVKVGKWLVDITTEEGRDFIKQYNSIVTVKSTDPDLANQKIKFSERANKASNTFNQIVQKRKKDIEILEADLKKRGYKMLGTTKSSEFRKVGKWNIDLTTKEGREFSRQLDEIPTVSSSEFKKIGGWIIDTTTKEGKEFVRDLENIPTVSSSEFGPGHYSVGGKIYKGKHPHGKLVSKDGGVKFSESTSVDFNKILEQTKGVLAGKVFSASEARKIGVGKGKNIFKNFFVPPSAEDFKGLLYAFIGKGEQGNAHATFFKEKLLDPFAEGSRNWNAYKQAMSNDYKALKKEFKGVGKKLKKKVKGTVFTNDNAIRVYLWNKAGFEIPGLSESQKQKLIDHVSNDVELKQFAEGLGIISRVPDGYIQPSDFWVVESIASDLSNVVRKIGRASFFQEWIDNKNEIFSPENLNKIEAVYGTNFRGELEKILYRMETGQNRTTGKDAQVNVFLDWINGSVGAVMFFNMRSATLQTISMANFINMADNNPVAAAAAFANMPQYIKDFAFIFNSDMLKQRRAGLQIDVSANELTSAFKDGKSKPQAIIHYLLEKGFTPTQIADSFAIAAGGATFYRNRLNKLIKDGMSETKAKEQAWLDFQEVAEETQQSSRPDLISNQQAGPLGRLILAWQNTPMQMTRLMKKKMSDFVNRRKIPGYTQFQSDMANISGIAYYGLIQNIYFGALQSGLMFMLFGWDDDEERKEKLEKRVANGALDSILRGTGIYGAAISTLKNVLLKWKEEREKPVWRRDDMNIAQELVNLSPPLGTKMRKIMSAIRTEKWNQGVSEEIGFRIENPNFNIAANWTEALTNLPVARLIDKANNIEEAVTGNHQMWQRIALLSGWSKWSLGIVDEELEKAKEAVKEKRIEEKKKIKDQEKEQKKKEQELKEKQEKEQKKKEGYKQVRCSGTNSSGKRCGLTTETKNKTWKCPHHMEFKDGMDRDNDGIKEYQCTGTTSSGKRCKNKGEYTGKIKRCYAHK